MTSIDVNDIQQSDLFRIISNSITPRPIAFVSTVDKEGNVNLSPFSFFNAFGVNPSTLIFSPARRGRDNTTKHTYQNVKEVAEVVINTVNYNMVQQMSLSSSDYDKGVNEFVKSGFTPIDSDLVKPPRVGESPVAFECKVREVIETGTGGGSGNLVICEVLKVHIQDGLLQENGTIDPNKLDIVGRLGGDYYVRASGDALFEVEKPLTKPGIGVDGLPEHIRNSKILTGNDLGILGNIKEIPSKEEIVDFSEEEDIWDFLMHNPSEIELHRFTQRFIHERSPMDALKLILASEL
jgi:flavin reductase (DIM6/NTAB) family NADH-FMN oxidoreductase RutF